MAVVDCIQTQNEDVFLVHRMARGDEAATAQLYSRYCDPLFRFVKLRLGGTHEDAEEVTNDVFHVAVRLAHTFDSTCSVFTWLCSLARKPIAMRFRAAGAAKRVPEKAKIEIDDASKAALRAVYDASRSVEDLVEKIDRVRIVQAMLNSMSPDQREAVVLRYVEGCSLSEVAQIMNRSEKAIERLLERAKEKPRKEMVGWLRDESFQLLCLELLTL